MDEAVHPYPTNDDTLQNNTCHRKKKRINQNQARNQNRFIGETIGEIEKSYHDKKSHKDGFNDSKYFFDNAHNPLNGIDLLKRKDHTDNSVAGCCESNEIGEIDGTIGKLDTRYQVCRDTYLTGNEKCSYDEEELQGYSDESEKKLMSTHKRSIDEIFDFSNLDMVG